MADIPNVIILFTKFRKKCHRLTIIGNYLRNKNMSKKIIFSVILIFMSTFTLAMDEIPSSEAEAVWLGNTNEPFTPVVLTNNRGDTIAAVSTSDGEHLDQFLDFSDPIHKTTRITKEARKNVVQHGFHAMRVAVKGLYNVDPEFVRAGKMYLGISDDNQTYFIGTDVIFVHAGKAYTARVVKVIPAVFLSKPILKRSINFSYVIYQIPPEDPS